LDYSTSNIFKLFVVFFEFLKQIPLRLIQSSLLVISAGSRCKSRTRRVERKNVNKLLALLFLFAAGFAAILGLLFFLVPFLLGAEFILEQIEVLAKDVDALASRLYLLLCHFALVLLLVPFKYVP